MSSEKRERKKKSKKDHSETDDTPMSLGKASGGGTASSITTSSSSFTQTALDQLLAIKARAYSHASQFTERLRTDTTFRQKTQVLVVVLLVCIVLVMQSAQLKRLTGGKPGIRGSPAGSRELGAKNAKPGTQKSNSRAVTWPEEEDMKSKLEFEAEELGFDVSKNDLLSVRRRYGTRAENENAQREAPKRADKKCLRFAATMQRDNPSELTYYLPHKVFDLPVLLRSLKRLGYTQTEDLKKATIALKGVPRITFRQLTSGKQYYDMVASLSRIGSKKKTQLATLRTHVKKFGCTFESLMIQPRSWDMNRPSDCKDFFEKHDDKGRMIILKSCKTGESSKGQGISVTDDLSEVREQWATCEPNAYNYVAQHYIENPLLIKNRKFDMRVYILVANTQPYIVFFNPGYIRRSLAEYKPSSTEKDDVLTNYHVQVTRKDFTPDEALWSFQQFIDYLKQEKLCRACGDLEIQLSKIARLVFDAGRESYVRHPGSFQLAGLDFMIDANLRPMFIEGNVSPGLGSHELAWKKKLMDDLLGMMYENVLLLQENPDEFNMVPGDRVYGNEGNYWQLLVHEQLESCDEKWKFDPCKEMRQPWKTWL